MVNCGLMNRLHDVFVVDETVLGQYSAASAILLGVSRGPINITQYAISLLSTRRVYSICVVQLC